LRLSRIGPLKHAFADFYSTTLAQAAADNGQYGQSVLVFFSQAGSFYGAPPHSSRGELRPVWRRSLCGRPRDSESLLRAGESMPD
jgi:hypothetical protein